jgi:hypothetical protein
MTISAERLSLSGLQLQTLLGFLERTGKLRVAVLSQNFEETLLVLIDGERWLVYADGTAERQVGS